VCTEVLEHVPDPVAALRKMVDLTKTGGHILITCPFLSLMHQAPFYFSSGLSPYWFMHWSRELNLEIESLQVSGDYLDLMIQENSRLLNSLIRIRGISRIFDLSLKLRSLIPKEIRESAGFGTFALLKKS
jgi:SAM-dependent methyltransferase